MASISNATDILVSPISFFEIGQKVRLGKWDEMAPYVERLPKILEEQGGMIAALDPRIYVNASMMRWEHRDPFDRLLAASALYYQTPLISADTAFDGIVTRIW